MRAINRALEGITVPTVVHLCFGYALLVAQADGYFLSELADSGAQQIRSSPPSPTSISACSRICPASRSCSVCSTSASQILETAEQVAQRLRAGTEARVAQQAHPRARLRMKYLSRELAFAKLTALAAGAAIMRKEIS